MIPAVTFVAGDVLTCGLDADARVMVVLRNGNPVGALSIPQNSGATRPRAYFPVISASAGEHFHVNFGAHPLRHHIPALPASSPISSTRGNRSVIAANWLLSCYRRILDEEEGEANTLLIAVLLQNLGPLVYEEGVCTYALLAFFQSLTPETLALCVNDVSTYFEDEELLELCSTLISFLSWNCRSAQLTQSPESGPTPHLRLLLALLQSRKLLYIWISTSSFRADLEGFFSIKQPTNNDTLRILPAVWAAPFEKSRMRTEWNIAEKNASEQHDHLVAAVRTVEALHISLVELLLRTNTTAVPLSSWLGALLARNSGYLKIMAPTGLSQLSTLCALHAALVAVSAKKLPGVAQTVDHFVRGLLPSFDTTRFGGTAEQCRVRAASLGPFPSQPGAAGCEERIFDACAALSHIAVSQRVRAVGALEQTLQQVVSKLDLMRSLNAQEDLEEIKEHSRNIARRIDWERAFVLRPLTHTESHNAGVLVGHLAHLMHHCCASEALLFLPDYYLRTLVDATGVLHSISPASPARYFFNPDMSGSGEVLRACLGALILLCNNRMVVLDDLRDMAIQCLAVFGQRGEYVRVLESMEISCETLMSHLCLSLSEKNWVSAVSLIRSCVQEDGFTVRSESDFVESTTSRILSDCLAKQLMSPESHVSPHLLHHCLDFLNWTMTEFSIVMGKMQSSLTPNSRVSEDYAALLSRSAALFDVSRTLLRIFEFVVSRAPKICFFDQPVTLRRLCEALVGVLQRTTVGNGAMMFSAIQRSSVATMPQIRVLAPTAAIFSLLYMHDATAGVFFFVVFLFVFFFSPGATFCQRTPPRVVELLCEMMDEADPLRFLAGFVSTIDDVSASQHSKHLFLMLEVVQKTLFARMVARAKATQLQNASGEGGAGGGGADGESQCTICFAELVNCVMLPCGHKAGRNCVQRQLQSAQKRCFFCKGPVVTAVDWQSTDAPE
eukprot:TRINITY_DN3356_c0_g1_i1.p1 TRINITY_DN3356_c0_g1~~TRINITY_DN3356_c0_g1_i1.p1  ORF type:complete len:954 (+),score=181.16 TRINITY_DN3356_c0_g1_i1:473-3334(+)